jgi:hypothetical protein
MVKIEFFLLLPIENHCGQNVQILKSFLGKSRSLNGYIQFIGQFVVILAQSWKNSAKSCITSAG